MKAISRFHTLIAAILVVLLAFSAGVSPAHAAPDGTPSDTKDVWLDIEVQVPEMFKGDVFVTLENTESHEYYTIEAHYVGSYRNSIFVPTGHYVVDNLYTSEDINAYGITMEDWEFDITGDTTLRPEVFQYGEGMTAEEMEELLQKGPGTIPDDPNDTGYHAPEVTETPAVSPTPGVQPSEQPSPEPSVEPTEQPSEQEPEEEPAGSMSLASMVIRIVTVFAILLVVGLALYGIVRKHNSLD